MCLNILREDWKPVLNLTSVMVGLQYLFLEPNPDDPLNKGDSLHRFSARTLSPAHGASFTILQRRPRTSNAKSYKLRSGTSS